MSVDLAALAWPAERVPAALELLGRARGLSPRIPPGPLLLEVPAGGEGLEARIEHVARALGLEVEAVEASYPDTLAMLRDAGPALVALPGGGPPRFLALLRSSGESAALLAPDHATARVPMAALHELVCRAIAAPEAPRIDALLDRAGVRGRARASARETLLRELLRDRRVGGVLVLRLPPSASPARQAIAAGLPRRALSLALAHTGAYAAWLLSWWIIGRSALSDRMDRGSIAAWALLLATMVPLQLLATWSAGQLSVSAGALLKRRLLAGALALGQDEIRAEGAGRLLGKVLESNAVEALALGGGLLAPLGALELCLAAVLLGAGATGALHPLLLLASVAGMAAFAQRYLRHRRRWTEARLEMTHGLVERLVGHRTRLAQQPRALWHEAEDQELARYVERSIRLDRRQLPLLVLPRAWMILGVVGLLPAFVSASAGSTALALTVAGMLFAMRPLQDLAGGLASLGGAAIAWREVAPLFAAAARPSSSGALPGAGGGGEGAVIEAHDVVFRHRGRAEPVLRGVSLVIRRGDRLLLEGPSGGGKSTLSAILGGLRAPESGLVLVGGLDLHTLGLEGFRRRVAIAPQFHENHVLTGTFAFNLLMGRRWPPLPADLDEAEAVCRELGLGALLARMPAGLMQSVGETGWQLSHGERSRLYIARALLQRADLVVLDESFAALDPETLAVAFRCVLARAPAVLVIAHP